MDKINYMISTIAGFNAIYKSDQTDNYSSALTENMHGYKICAHTALNIYDWSSIRNRSCLLYKI